MKKIGSALAVAITILSGRGRGALPAALLLLLALAGNLAAQNETSLTYSLSTCQFRINDSLTLAEISFAIPTSGLAFVAQDAGYRSEFEIRVDITQEGIVQANRWWRSHARLDSLAEVDDTRSLFSTVHFQVKPGEYEVETSVQDVQSDRRSSRRFPVEIVAFRSDSLNISQIQLASRITRDTTGLAYSKNGYRVIANPGQAYGDQTPLLRFYSEIYNLTFPSETGYSITFRVLDTRGDTVLAFPAKKHTSVGTSVVEVGGFNVMGLPSGLYLLELAVEDHASGQTARRREPFVVQRQRDVLAAQTTAAQQRGRLALLQEFRAMSEAELDAEFEVAGWIASRDDKKIYAQLDVEGKRNYLANFWYQRDPDPSSAGNALRDDYLARARLANQEYGSRNPGWRTDRGRILLTYGRPDEIENFPSSANLRPYQIWHYYELAGGLRFYFVNTRSWGEYELVHSTARNEIRDPDWQRWLRLQGDAGGIDR